MPLWDFFDDHRIRLSKLKADRATDQLHHLRQQHRQLRIVTEALCSLMQQRLGVSDEELQEQIVEVSTAVHLCPACDRPVSHTATNCTYCGEKLDGPNPFAGT